MAPRLKIFEWTDGFHRFTVATSSRPKALAAWGMQQDIFASGLAREASDSDDAEAARAAPGRVIERGLAVDVGHAGPRREKKKPRSGPTVAQKRRIQALVDQLQRLESSHAEAMDELERETRIIERRRVEEMRSFSETRDRLVRDLEAARAES